MVSSTNQHNGDAAPAETSLHPANGSKVSDPKVKQEKVSGFEEITKVKEEIVAKDNTFVIKLEKADESLSKNDNTTKKKTNDAPVTNAATEAPSPGIAVGTGSSNVDVDTTTVARLGERHLNDNGRRSNGKGKSVAKSGINEHPTIGIRDNGFDTFDNNVSEKEDIGASVEAAVLSVVEKIQSNYPTNETARGISVGVPDKEAGEGVEENGEDVVGYDTADVNDLVVEDDEGHIADVDADADADDNPEIDVEEVHKRAHGSSVMEQDSSDEAFQNFTPLVFPRPLEKLEEIMEFDIPHYNKRMKTGDKLEQFVSAIDEVTETWQESCYSVSRQLQHYQSIWLLLKSRKKELNKQKKLASLRQASPFSSDS